MLSTVILEGPLGKQFGRKWKLAASTPGEALRLIEANKPGLFAWIRDNLKKYSRYRVLCEYESGRKVEFDTDTFKAANSDGARIIRFVPLIEGASGAVKFVVGAIMVAISYFFPVTAPYLLKPGLALMAMGAAQMLMGGKKIKSNESKDTSSNYFDGPGNTDAQGAPVPLIYGRCLVGSQCISMRITVDRVAV